MNAIRLMVLTVICWCPVVAADNAPGSATTEVAALLREFIAGAGKGNPALFERFFADDVLYTRASGALVTKADILKSLRGAPPDEQSSYTAEDVTLHEHGDTVIVAFRLEGRTEGHGTVQRLRFRNTGVFLRRSGRWQAIAWQATAIDAPSSPR